MHRISGKIPPEAAEPVSSPPGVTRPTGQIFATLWLLLLALAVMSSACQPAPQAAAALPTSTVAHTATTTIEATRQPPVVVAMEATATNLPSFAPEPLAPAPTATPALTSTPASSPTATVTRTVATTSLSATVATTATTAIAPTFTPPAPPETLSADHYWFNRPVAQGGIVWTDKHYPYGSTRGGQLRAHHGVEFNVPYNTEILAVAPGTVVVAGNDAGVAYGPHTNFYGNLVVIRHDFQHNGQPVFSLYGHLNETLVTEGQQVAGQEVIGLSGATGVADGPHVHLEVRVGENSYSSTRSPLLWLNPFPDRGTIAGRVVWPDGQPVAEAPVSFSRVDGEAPYYGTTTYAGESVNPDPDWNENFVVDDVVPGFYQVTVNDGSKKYKAETWVYPRRTSFVEIVLE